MANTYTQIYIHVVFAVKHRSGIILPSWKERLYQYISGIVRTEKQKALCINGMADHIHILLSLNGSCSLSDLVRIVKTNSTKWINESGFIKTKFEWQTGYGAFSVSPKNLEMVKNYIQSQEQQHRKQSFREEYVEFLTSAGIEFEERYLPEDLGNTPE